MANARPPQPSAGAHQPSPVPTEPIEDHRGSHGRRIRRVPDGNISCERPAQLREFNSGWKAAAGTGALKHTNISVIVTVSRILRDDVTSWRAYKHFASWYELAIDCSTIR
jgi:hypothetical protein